MFNKRPQQNGGSSMIFRFYFAPGCVFIDKMKKQFLNDLKYHLLKNNIVI